MESLIIFPEIPVEDFRKARVAKALAEVMRVFRDVPVIRTAQELMSSCGKEELKNKKILMFCVLDEVGMNDSLQAMRRVFRLMRGALSGSVAALIVDGASELDTKDVARDIAFDMNACGAMLLPKCLAEGTGSLQNYELRAEKENCSLHEAYIKAVLWVASRLNDFEPPRVSGASRVPNILCVHAGDRATSNTMYLWSLVKEGLGDGADISEICLRDGALPDCRGCGVKSCTYFSENRGCYYGGIMVESVYPALMACDALVMLAPNYNDALSANLTAMINRMTALSSKEEFTNKYLFALVVSGYSGSDLLMRQMIGALGMNRSFIIPGGFAMHKTAYHPGDLEKNQGIIDEAENFARHMLTCLQAPLIQTIN